ncbi:MAG: ankyrin repeat domain-containing protein [Acidobacteria bacterium]|nr:ankyrin repeat domain-containing protein [Acidobacteriota bacterium]
MNTAGVSRGRAALKRVVFMLSTVLFIVMPSATWGADDAMNQQLLDAVQAGDILKVRAALALRADINARTADGLSPLMLATIWRHVEVAEELLARGARVHDRVGFGLAADRGIRGLNSLDFAFKKDYPELIALFAAKGAEDSLRLGGTFYTVRMHDDVYIPSPNVTPELGKPNFSGTWDLDKARSNKGKRSRYVVQVEQVGKYLLRYVSKGSDFGAEEFYAGHLLDGSEARFGKTRFAAKWVGDVLELNEWSESGKGNITPGKTERWALVDNGDALQIVTKTSSAQAGLEVYLKRLGPDTSWRRSRPIFWQVWPKPTNVSPSPSQGSRLP